MAVSQWRQGRAPSLQTKHRSATECEDIHARLVSGVNFAEERTRSHSPILGCLNALRLTPIEVTNIVEYRSRNMIIEKGQIARSSNHRGEPFHNCLHCHTTLNECRINETRATFMCGLKTDSTSAAGVVRRNGGNSVSADRPWNTDQHHQHMHSPQHAKGMLTWREQQAQSRLLGQKCPRGQSYIIRGPCRRSPMRLLGICVPPPLMSRTGPFHLVERDRHPNQEPLS